VVNEVRRSIYMCLAIPAKVLNVKGSTATVDFGDGTHRRVNVSLVDASVDEYVIVHAGFAIEVLDKEEAEKTLALWRELLSQESAV
jgi:hydrogenase expression/formation protein HypC